MSTFIDTLVWLLLAAARTLLQLWLSLREAVGEAFQAAGKGLAEGLGKAFGELFTHLAIFALFALALVVSLIVVVVCACRRKPVVNAASSSPLR
jgi:hypothetical protein